jgi:hypothetical protein
MLRDKNISIVALQIQSPDRTNNTYSRPRLISHTCSLVSNTNIQKPQNQIQPSPSVTAIQSIASTIQASTIQVRNLKAGQAIFLEGKLGGNLLKDLFFQQILNCRKTLDCDRNCCDLPKQGQKFNRKVCCKRSYSVEKD